MKGASRGTAAPAHHVGPNMTPLVDVVMVILIFLMLAGSFAPKEVFRKVQTGEAPTWVRPTPPVSGVGPQLDVFVSDGGGSGVFSVQPSGDPKVIRDPATLQAELERRRAEYAAAGTPAETVQVVIHPTAGTAWAPVVAAHEAALGAQFPKTGFGYAR